MDAISMVMGLLLSFRCSELLLQVDAAETGRFAADCPRLRTCGPRRRRCLQPLIGRAADRP